MAFHSNDTQNAQYATIYPTHERHDLQLVDDRHHKQGFQFDRDIFDIINDPYIQSNQDPIHNYTQSMWSDNSDTDRPTI